MAALEMREMTRVPWGVRGILSRAEGLLRNRRAGGADPEGTIRAIARDMCEPYILETAACVPDAAQKIVFDHCHAARHVRKEAAGSHHLDLVRDRRMPGRGGSA